MTSNTFVSAIRDQQNFTTSENGDVGLKSTLNACVDLYSSQGALRGNINQYLEYFNKAYKEDKRTALALLFKLRDIRGGQGERDLTRTALKELEKKGFHFTFKFFDVIVELGRVDDLFVFEKKETIRKVAQYLRANIPSHPSLKDLKEELKTLYPNDNELHANVEKIEKRVYYIAKWLPRNPNKNKPTERLLLKYLREELNWNRGELRRWCSHTAKTVEQQISANKWDEVNYSHVPSKALNQYRKAFERHTPERYQSWVESLTKENTDTKVNVGTLYPYDIINATRLGYSFYARDVTSDNASDMSLMRSQWNALPNLLGELNKNILPIIDLSGSMTDNLPKSSVTIMDVAISLGIYLSQRNNGSLKGAYGAFAEEPVFNVFDTNASLEEIWVQIRNDKVGYSTDFDLMYRTLLAMYKQYNVKPEDTAEVLFIVSDMNFNSAGEGSYSDGGSNVNLKSKNELAYNRMLQAYTDAGYKAPKLVFWNVKHNGSFVCKAHQEGIVELSGYSPNILKDVLSSLDNITPVTIMEKGLEKYYPLVDNVLNK